MPEVSRKHWLGNQSSLWLRNLPVAFWECPEVFLAPQFSFSCPVTLSQLPAPSPDWIPAQGGGWGRTHTHRPGNLGHGYLTKPPGKDRRDASGHSLHPFAAVSAGQSRRFPRPGNWGSSAAHLCPQSSLSSWAGWVPGETQRLAAGRWLRNSKVSQALGSKAHSPGPSLIRPSPAKTQGNHSLQRGARDPRFTVCGAWVLAEVAGRIPSPQGRRRSAVPFCTALCGKVDTRRPGGGRPSGEAGDTQKGAGAPFQPWSPLGAASGSSRGAAGCGWLRPPGGRGGQ